MKRLGLFILFVCFACTGMVSAQTWPNYHLTNGTHNTSYGVEDYDALNPIKNLYIDPVAILQAGSTELDSIYDGNQVFLNGGTAYASVIDADDFTWNSGNLHLNGGIHTATYGLDSGAEKILNIDSGALVQQTVLSPLAAGNQLNLNEGGKLSVGDFNASMTGFQYNGGTLEVSGSLTGLGMFLPYDDGFQDHYNTRTINLNGPAANWNLGTKEILVGSPDIDEAHVRSMTVTGGASLITDGGELNGHVDVSGTGSHWDSGALKIGYLKSSVHMTISNGGSVSSTRSVIGRNFDGNYNSVTVTGANSRWDILGGLTLGIDRGTGNHLTVSDGGTVTSSICTIGGERGSDRNSVEVSGKDSIWLNSGNLVVGEMSVRNKLTVSDGGTVSNANAYVGKGAGSDGSYYAGANSVEVTGVGSKWINSGSLTIGYDSEDGGNYVVIENGGEVIVKDGINIPYSANLNRLSLNSGGRLTIQTNFNAVMGGFNYNSGSTLAVQGQLSSLSILEAGRRLEANNVLGDMTVHGTYAPGNSPADSLMDGALTIAADGTLEMELGGYELGTEYDRLTVTELSTLVGLLDIVFLDGFSVTNGASFDLFNWDGGVVGEFASISTPTLSGDLEWDTSDLYSTGTLSVIPEPSVVSLLGVFGGGLWIIRRYFPSV